MNVKDSKLYNLEFADFFDKLLRLELNKMWSTTNSLHIIPSLNVFFNFCHFENKEKFYEC